MLGIDQIEVGGICDVVWPLPVPVDMEVRLTVFMHLLRNNPLFRDPEFSLQLCKHLFLREGTFRISKEELPRLETESLYEEYLMFFTISSIEVSLTSVAS